MSWDSKIKSSGPPGWGFDRRADILISGKFILLRVLYRSLGMELEPNSDSGNDIWFLNSVRGTSGHCIGLEPLHRLHRRTKIKIYKTIIRNVICYGSETWVMTKRTEMALGAFECKILRRIFGPVQQNAQWRICYNDELYNLYNDNDIVTFIKLRRLEWAGHVYL